MNANGYIMTTWTSIEGGSGVKTCSYSFGPGLSNCVVVPAKDGVVVISPAMDLAAAAYDELDAAGVRRIDTESDL